MKKKINQYTKLELNLYITQLISDYDKEHNCETPHKTSISKRIAGQIYSKLNHDDIQNKEMTN